MISLLAKQNKVGYYSAAIKPNQESQFFDFSSCQYEHWYKPIDVEYNKCFFNQHRKETNNQNIQMYRWLNY